MTEIRTGADGHQRVGPFPTEEEAQREADHLNSFPRDPSYSDWVVTGGRTVSYGDLPIEVSRSRMVGPADLTVEPRVFEERLRDGVNGPHHDLEVNSGIRVCDAQLEGESPETRLLIFFESRKFGRVCGLRSRIWPAEFADPGWEAAQYVMYMMEDHAGWKPVQDVVDDNGVLWLSMRPPSAWE